MPPAMLEPKVHCDGLLHVISACLLCDMDKQMMTRLGDDTNDNDTLLAMFILLGD